MTYIDNDNITIDGTDLSNLLSSERDDNGLYYHNGTSSISLADGDTTSAEGYYVWDGVALGWEKLGATEGDREEFLSADVLARQRSGGEYVAIDETGVISQDTDGPTVLQAAVNAVPSVGSLEIRDSWTIDAAADRVEVADSMMIRGNGATINISGNIDNAVYTSPENVGSEISLNTDASHGTRTFDVTDDSSFSEGDLVGLRRDTTIDDKEQSEIHYVRDVSSGTVTVEDVLYYDYPTSDNAVAQAITPIKVEVENISFVGSGSSNEDQGLGLSGVHNGAVRNCTFRNVGQWACSISHSYNVDYRGNDIHGSNMDGYGYGVIPSNGVAHIEIASCAFNRCRHGVSVGNSPNPIGLPRAVTVHDCHFTDGRGHAADSHGDVISMTCRDNEVHLGDGTRIAFFMGSVESAVERNRVYGSSDASLFGTRDNAQIDYIKVSDNDIWLEEADGNTPLINFRNANEPYGDLIVRNNVLHEGYANTGIYFANVTGTVKIEGNVLQGFHDSGIDPSGNSTLIDTITLGDFGSPEIVIQNNVFKNVEVGGSAIMIDGRDGTDYDIFIEGNEFVNCIGSSGGGGSIEFWNVTGATIKNNEVRSDNGDFIWYGFYLDGSTGDLVVEGNRFAEEVDIVIYKDNNMADSIFRHNHGHNDARSVEPTSPTAGWEYLDDGTNTGSGNPGYRYYDGTAWNDL